MDARHEVSAVITLHRLTIEKLARVLLDPQTRNIKPDVAHAMIDDVR